VKTKWKLLGFVGGLLGTTTLSSVATQYVAGRLGYHPVLGSRILGLYQPFGWIAWQMEPWAAKAWQAFLWPDIGLMVAAAGLLGVAVVKNIKNGTRRPKAFPNVHGSARWAEFADIQAMNLLDNNEGVYIGAWENPKTGVVHYLRDTSGAHIAGIAPTRSGKGLGWVLPNALSCVDSMFIYDPKGELWQLTAGWRKSIGHNVIRWQPAHPTDSCGFNFLEEIRLGTDYEVADSQNIAHLIVDPDGAGFSTHWDKAAFGFLTGFLLHCAHVAQDAGTVASLPTAAQLLSSPKLKPLALCQAMAASKYGAAINAAGVDQLERDIKEAGAVLSTVKTYLLLFMDPIIARNCDQSSFRIADLMDHNQPTTLYIVVSSIDSARVRPLVRLLITMVLNQTVGVPIKFSDEQQPVRAHKHKMLLMMEEFPELRKMKMFEQAMAVMAGAGLTAFLIMQDREQLLGAYGQHQTIMANVHLIGAYAPNEIKTADWLQHELGNKTVSLEQYSESGKRGGWLSNISHSFHSFGHPLLTSDEIKRLPGVVKNGSKVVRAGKMLILATGQYPILGRQILYFEDAVWNARSRLLPPAASDNLELIRQFRVATR
jgi:type IV secretion system protein VirD4